MTTPTDSEYDPAVHLSFGDVAVDDRVQPMVIRVAIQLSKTDPFRKGILHLVIGRTPIYAQ